MFNFCKAPFRMWKNQSVSTCAMAQRGIGTQTGPQRTNMWNIGSCIAKMRAAAKCSTSMYHGGYLLLPQNRPGLWQGRGLHFSALLRQNRPMQAASAWRGRPAAARSSRPAASGAPRRRPSRKRRRGPITERRIHPSSSFGVGKDSLTLAMPLACNKIYLPSPTPKAHTDHLEQNLNSLRNSQHHSLRLKADVKVLP